MEQKPLKQRVLIEKFREAFKTYAENSRAFGKNVEIGPRVKYIGSSCGCSRDEELAGFAIYGDTWFGKHKKTGIVDFKQSDIWYVSSDAYTQQNNTLSVFMRSLSISPKLVFRSTVYTTDSNAYGNPNLENYKVWGPQWNTVAEGHLPADEKESIRTDYIFNTMKKRLAPVCDL